MGCIYSPPISDVIIAKKTADQTVNNSIVLVDDSELKIPVKANQNLILVIVIIHNETAVADIDFAWTVPAGATLEGFETLANVTAPQTGINLVTETTCNGAGAKRYTSYLASYIGAAAAGNIQLQWAQHTAEVSDCKVIEGSSIIAFKA